MRVELLAKIIPSVLPASGFSRYSPRFIRGGEVEQGEELGAGEVGDREEVAEQGTRRRESGVWSGVWRLVSRVSRLASGNRRSQWYPPPAAMAIAGASPSGRSGNRLSVDPRTRSSRPCSSIDRDQ